MISRPKHISRSRLGSAFETVLRFGRSIGQVLVEPLWRAYDIHTERALMRLAPDKPRSWRDIPHAGAHLSYY